MGNSLTLTATGTSGICLLQQTTATTYDDDGNALTVTDALGRVTTNSFNDLDQLVSTTDPNGDTTAYTYDVDGNVLSETDPDNNLTIYAYNDAGQVTSKIQTIQIAGTVSGPVLETTTTYQYDANGNLVETADALANASDGKGTGDVIVYTYNALNEKTGEYWYSTIGTAAADPTHSYPSTAIVYSYDPDGELSNATESNIVDETTVPVSGYTYTYNSLGQQITSDNLGGTGTPNVPDVLLTSTYDADGNRTSLSAQIGSAKTPDFVDSYQYDSSNRAVQVTQDESTGGDYVERKTVNFTYDADGETSTIDRRYGDLVRDGGCQEQLRVRQFRRRGEPDAQHVHGDQRRLDLRRRQRGVELCRLRQLGGQLLERRLRQRWTVDGRYGRQRPQRHCQRLRRQRQPDDAHPAQRHAKTTSLGTDGNTLLFDGANNYQYDADGNVVLSWTSTTAQSGRRAAAPGK